MNAPVAATLRPNSAFRKQIRTMYERDGASAEDIALMLDMPKAVVDDVLEKLHQTAEPTEKSDEDTDYIERLEAARRSERDLEQYRERAIEAYAECLDSDLDAIKLAAADRVTKILAGGLRPEKPAKQNAGASITIEQMNVMIQQATSAYQKALETQPTKIVEVVNSDGK